ncbi:SlyX family protein [Bacterioplanoides pacificum]|uniref:Protein SlyX homolog n=1 Tax=Bacterioplanoides pacificum TaxID=1171596 RepID=A0ABV7VN07_9GAMM
MPNNENTAPEQQERINELESRLAFLENTVDDLNSELAELSQQFTLAKRAMQMMHQKLEQMGGDQAGIKNPADETPPPHY